MAFAFSQDLAFGGLFIADLRLIRLDDLPVSSKE